MLGNLIKELQKKYSLQIHFRPCQCRRSIWLFCTFLFVADPTFSSTQLLDDYINNVTGAKNTVVGPLQLFSCQQYKYFQVICDELQISPTDRKLLCAGEKSDLERTLANMRDRSDESVDKD